MPKLAPGELSKHKSKGYRLTCGWYVGSDGKRRPKVFWLGQQKDRALLEAARIRWYSWVAAAEGGWNPTLIARMKATDTIPVVRQRYIEAELTRQQLTPHLSPEIVVQASPSVQLTLTASQKAVSGIPMFHVALDAFVETIQTQKLSRSHKKTIRDSIVAFKRYHADVPLADVDYARLEKLTNHLKNRPLSRRKDARTGEYAPIKPYTVKRVLQHLRLAIQWISRQHQSDRFAGWAAPAEWRDLFRVELKLISDN
jgi:hypothetical protein